MLHKMAALLLKYPLDHIRNRPSSILLLHLALDYAVFDEDLIAFLINTMAWMNG